jgi:hypothetical protein
MPPVDLCTLSSDLGQRLRENGICLAVVIDKSTETIQVPLKPLDTVVQSRIDPARRQVRSCRLSKDGYQLSAATSLGRCACQNCQITSTNAC